MNAHVTEGTAMKALREGNPSPANEYFAKEGKSWTMEYMDKRLGKDEAQDVYELSVKIAMEVCGRPGFELRRPLVSYFRDVVESQCAILMVHEGGEKRKQVMREIAAVHRQPLERFLRTRTQPENVEDLASQSIVMLIENILDGKFKGRSSLETYLWSIVRNQLKKWYGKKANVEIEEKNLQPLEIVQDPETGFIQRELKEKVAQIMGNLGEKCQQVLRMWMMRYRMKEIAETMGYSNEAVVRNTKKRCFQNVEKLIRENPEVKRLLTELS